MRRALSLGGAAIALSAAWLAPLEAVIAGPFSAHMTRHMAVVAVAAPLCAFGLAGGRFDPVVRARALFPALPATMVELVVVWAWHTPALHHAARHTHAGFVLEQATFFASGLYVWLSAVAGSPAARRERTGAGVMALLLTSMHMTLLGALIALSPRPLFAHGPWASALADQHLGGAIMLVVGGVSYLAGGLWLSARLLLPEGGVRAP